MSTNVTLTGRIGKDVDLRFLPSGKAVASFPLVTSRNKKDQDGNWSETETTWWQVSGFDTLAENIAESLSKGDAVIVVGRAYTETYKGRDGNERQSLKVEAYAVGPDLKRQSAKLSRTERAPGRSTAAADDPWATPGTDEPPF